MATIANLLVHVGVTDDIERGMAGARSKLEAGADKMVAVGTKLTRNVTLPIIAVGTGLFALASRQEQAEAKLSSSFESMGAAAWTTVDALHAQARAFQDLTTFGDEAILDFQAVLLTFGNVTGQVFTDATRLGLDMSAKLGTDLQSSAIQLGKALNDPVQGISALSRVGVSFTQDQKAMVKQMSEAGDMAGAQALILSELEKQFGGTAEAMAATGAGRAKQAMNALGDAGETIGVLLVPAVTKLAGWLKTLAGWFQNLSPETKEWIVRLGAIAAAVGPVLLIGGKMVQLMFSLSAAFGVVGKAFLALSRLMMANPWVLLIAAVIALVTIIVMNWDKILAFLKKAWDWIKSAASAVGDWLKNTFKGAVDFLVGLFLNFTPLGLIIKHFDTLKAAVTTAANWIRAQFDGVVSFFTGIGTKIANATRGMWDGIKNAFRSALNWLIDKWNGLQFTIPSINLPWGGSIGGATIKVPQIPRFHEGGIVPGRPGQEVLINAMAGERITPAGKSDQPVHVVLQLDGKPFYEAMVKQSRLDGSRNTVPRLAT